MGFIDSSSSCITAILTRKGRELIARNDGSFKITQFAFSDDEINYQLYNPNIDGDIDILSLPVLEPSSNENTALRYRVVTMPKGSVSVAFLIAVPTSLLLQNRKVPNSTQLSTGTITVKTQAGFDYSGYSAITRNGNYASVPVNNITSTVNTNGETYATIQINSGYVDGTTFIDITGKDTGAIISIPVTTSSNAST